MSQFLSRALVLFCLSLSLVLGSPVSAEEARELTGWAYENDPDFDSESDSTSTSQSAPDRTDDSSEEKPEAKSSCH